MDIRVNVVNQKLKIPTNLKNFVAGTQEFIRFVFNFIDDDWDDLTTFAQFTQGGVGYNQLLDSDKSVYLPSEIVDGVFTLMLYGSGGTTIATTNYLTLKMEDNIFIDDAQSTGITRSLYDQLVSIVKQSISTPLSASTADKMTDTSRIYVYTGDETGYNNGYWYYYDGSEWISGGVYNAVTVQTDVSLSVAGMPADSSMVGARLNNNESYISTLESQIAELQEAMLNISIDADDLGLEQDEDTYYVYPTYKGIRSENGIPLASSGGGGGGGGDVISAILNVTNTTGWLSKTIASGSDCDISLVWSSTEDGMPTGDGNIRISVNDVVRTTYQISQGNVFVNLAPYLATGTNKVKVRISDTYDQGKTITFNITSIALSITSTFDSSTVYSGAISFPYTPVGAVEKTVYFILDGQTIGTQTTQVSNRQMSYTIPSQSHGAHSLRVYFESTINNETVRSNELYYEFLFVDSLTTTPIIASSFNTKSMPQYSTIALPFLVYTPATLTSKVTISVNGTVVSTQTVDRTEQSFSYKANQYGTLTFVISTGNVSKTISLTITESKIDVKAETEDLALYLSSQGRSNAESTRNVWTYGEGASQIACTLSGFNWTSDGWQTDDDNATLLRVSGNARVTIPYKPFAQDFRTTGKTIELEFATRNVLDYDATILSCMSGGRGLELTPQKATLKSEQSEISVQYKENEHIRVTFVVEKRAENRLVFVFINSIPSGVIEYPTNDDFSQISPVNIAIGSNDATIDLYCIRVYDNNLTRHQVLDNWIADTTDGSEMLDRYSRNNVYDAYGNITIANLPSYIPYFILNADELPQYKGDKKTITGTYTDPMYPSKSFTFTGCQINVQGTSSAPYARKNYDMQFKNGFELASGHANQYALRTGAIPFNRFVLKADVASSEGANNVELVRLYNDACPYKTPEMVEDSRVRWGIDGFPIVVFWNDTATGTVKFLGKYNFNLPKRAPAPYGYSEDGTMESWEFQNNRDALMLFQSDYFNMEMRTDPDTGETKEAWRFDYEARFPSDEWTDISILQEFQTFVYSTWRQNAPNTALPASVTYGGVTYTTDNADYRLAKFKNEFPTYAELDSFIFYYIFTEQFLMVDSRAKNLFIGFNGSPVTVSGRKATRKATAQPYDMDTAIGTNNEGSLVNSYNVEDADYGGVYTGEGSVLWENVHDAFNTEIVQMYQSLRSQGILSFDTVETRFEEHQSIWSEAIWLEDSWFKYIDPLINPDAGKQPTSMYLPMMQGSKEQQRKWWLSNRFRYQDSRWHCGDALLSPIQLRAYSKGNITVTPYFDIYATVRYGTPIVTQRSTHGQATTLVCPPEVTTFYDTEIYIYSAQQIASVGDLSPLKVGLADFSGAINLQEVKLGDSSSSYNNDWLYQLSFGSNRLLKKIDVRNCAGLGNTNIEGHTQTTVDISGCEVIEEVYFDGTNIKGLTLPNGGVLKVISLPSTITGLVVQNQSQLTTFSVTNNDYSNIETLRIENCSSVIPVMDILDDIKQGSRVRIIGFTTTANGASDAAKKTDIEEFYAYLDTMRGLDEYGNNVATAQVQGIITGIDTLTGAWLAQMKAKYPYIDITYNHITSNLFYYNGETLYYTESITDGANGVYTGTPTKANSSDGHYSYTFAGWSKDDDNTVDADARTNVTADRNVYACYTANVRKYTITWRNNGTTIRTDTDVEWGTKPVWGQAMPSSGGQTATGWDYDLNVGITGNTTINAKYVPQYTATFVLAAVDSPTGSQYTLASPKFDEGSTPVYSGSTPTTAQGDSTEFTFTGWSPALAPIYANTTYVAQFQDNRAATIQYLSRNIAEYESNSNTTFAEYGLGYATKLTSAKAPATLVDGYAFANDTNLEVVDLSATSGTVTIANNAFGGCTNLQHVIIRSSTMATLSSTGAFTGTPIALGEGAVYVPTSLVATYKANTNWSNYYIADIADYPLSDFSTVTDSWSTIIANNNYATAYTVGDTKLVDLGTFGKHYFELVAMDEDTKVSGGKARMTWLNKNLLTTHVMNSNGTTTGGYDASDMKSWLTSDVLPQLQSEIRNAIVPVTKISGTYKNNAVVVNGQSTTESLWIPSEYEIFGTTTYENTGAQYSKFDTAAKRIKYNLATGSAGVWWLRSAYSGTLFRYVDYNGSAVYYNASYTNGVVLGFCI